MLDPGSVLGRRMIGLVHLARAEYEQASAEIDRALALNPSDSVGLQAQAEALLWLVRLARAEYEEASAEMESSLALTPSYRVGLQSQSEALRWLGCLGESIELS